MRTAEPYRLTLVVIYSLKLRRPKGGVTFLSLQAQLINEDLLTSIRAIDARKMNSWNHNSRLHAVQR